MYKSEIITVSIVILSIFVVILLLFCVFYNNKNVDEKIKKEAYYGIVKKIEYDEKRYPTLYVNDTCYYVGSKYNDINEVIKVGDSIVKNYNRLDYLVYRKDNQAIWKLIYGKL